jgi:hypothetical protein
MQPAIGVSAVSLAGVHTREGARGGHGHRPGPATSIPVTAVLKAHGGGAGFGRLLVTPTLSGTGQRAAPQYAQ